jgi:hypothetical protein
LQDSQRGIGRQDEHDCSARWLCRVRAANRCNSAAFRESDRAQRRPHNATKAARKKKARSKCSCAAPSSSIGAGWGAGFAAQVPSTWGVGQGIGGSETPNGSTSPDAKAPIGSVPTIKFRG